MYLNIPNDIVYYAVAVVVVIIRPKAALTLLYTTRILEIPDYKVWFKVCTEWVPTLSANQHVTPMQQAYMRGTFPHGITTLTTTTTLSHRFHSSFLPRFSPTHTRTNFLSSHAMAAPACNSDNCEAYAVGTPWHPNLIGKLTGCVGPAPSEATTLVRPACQTIELNSTQKLGSQYYP